MSRWLPMMFALLTGVASAADADDPRDFDRDRAAVIRAAVQRVAPSIVTIETIGGAQPIGDNPAATQPRGPGARGPAEPSFRVADGPTTGLVWSVDGWIVTSAFNFVRDPIVTTVVLTPPAPPLKGGEKATLEGGEKAGPRRFVARLVARDQIRRIALLKIDAVGLPVPEWAPANECRAGQYAIACGRGFGEWFAGPEGASRVPAGFPLIQMGIISAMGRRNGMAVQTDAKASPANYGGPLIDIDGRVIGLIVPMGMTGDPVAGVEWYDSGIGFAIADASITHVIARLKSGENIEPGKLGVSIADAADGRCRVAGVAVPSPAHDQGIRKDDIVLSLEGQAVGDHMELLRRLSDRAAGEPVVVRLERGKRRAVVEVRVVLARASQIGAIPGEAGEEGTSTRPAAPGRGRPRR